MWYADRILCGYLCQGCFEYGYQLIIPEGTCTTFDGKDIPAETINEFYEGIWEGALQMS